MINVYHLHDYHLHLCTLACNVEGLKKAFLQCTWLPTWPLEHRLSTSWRLIYKQVGLWLTSSWKTGNGSLGKASNSSTCDSTGTIMVVALISQTYCNHLLPLLRWTVTARLMELHRQFSGMECREAHLHGCLCNLMSLHMWCDQTRTRLLYWSLCTDLISLQGVNVMGCILGGCKWHKQLDEKTSNFKLNSSNVASNTHLDKLPPKKLHDQKTYYRRFYFLAKKCGCIMVFAYSCSFIPYVRISWNGCQC